MNSFVCVITKAYRTKYWNSGAVVLADWSRYVNMKTVAQDCAQAPTCYQHLQAEAAVCLIKSVDQYCTLGLHWPGPHPDLDEGLILGLVALLMFGLRPAV